MRNLFKVWPWLRIRKVNVREEDNLELDKLDIFTI